MFLAQSRAVCWKQARELCTSARRKKVIWWWLYMASCGKCLSLHLIWFSCARYSPGRFFSLWMCSLLWRLFFVSPSLINVNLILLNNNFRLFTLQCNDDIYYFLKDVLSLVYFPKELTITMFCMSLMWN